MLHTTTYRHSRGDSSGRRRVTEVRGSGQGEIFVGTVKGSKSPTNGAKALLVTLHDVLDPPLRSGVHEGAHIPVVPPTNNLAVLDLVY
jgi:hypothetical protein